MSLDDVQHHEWLLGKDLDALHGAAFDALDSMTRDREQIPDALYALRRSLVTTLCAVEALTAARYGAGLSNRCADRQAS